MKLNINMEEPKGDRKKEDIAAELMMTGIEDILSQFSLQWRPWFRDGRKWGMVRAGREVRPHTDYIIGTYCRIFRNVVIRDPQHNSYYYLVLG